MEIDIITFGKIAEFMGSQRITFTAIQDTDGLQQSLEKSFPLLRNMKYKLAVNKNIIQQNTLLKNNDLVAIMPPFSGG
jgi:molybdopterin synthase sulfur carrier subunit